MTGGKTARRKTIGILGGMGPEATADLFIKIIKATPATKDQEHLRVVIDSNPAIPDRTAYILGKGEDPTPLLMETAKNVESMGAGLIAVPCNTAHYFHGAIQAAVKIPVLHMMQEVARVLKGSVERVGILATTGTLKTGLYHRYLSEAGISVIVPAEEDQDEVMDAIYAVKSGDLKKGREIALRQGARLVRAGAQAVIAGCTELPLVLKDGDLEVPVIDPTKVLAEACVKQVCRGVSVVAHNEAVLFQNGRFHVFPQETREREALAACHGRILYVGDREDARNSFPAGTQVKVVDLEGKVAVPGFIDSHMHLMSLGIGLRHLSLNDVSFDLELKSLVAERAKTAAPDEWILGRGWDQDFFAEKRYPTKKDLDEVGAGRPVCLTRACGHLAVVSSKALELAGITRDTPDPPGGVIDRDPYGDPTGVLRESAQGLVRSKIPEPGREVLLESTKGAIKYLLERGITSVHPNDGYAGVQEIMEIYREAREAGFPIRVYWDLPYDLLDELTRRPLRTGDGDDYFRIGAVKIFADGSLGGRTAALEEPYSDDPGTSGILVLTEEELRARVYKAHALGMQVAVHAIGDRAVRVALEAIGYAQSKITRERPRHRVVHAQILSPGLISEIKSNGVIADVQPKFLTTDMRWAQERVGLRRMRSSYAWRTMLKAGVHMAAGFDCPVEPADPLWGIYAAVTRKDMEGEPKTSYYPNERITVEEALRMFTVGGAYAEFAEHRKGTLEPGKLADFTVLSENIFRVPHDSIKDIKVEMTVVGGNVAYVR